MAIRLMLNPDMNWHGKVGTRELEVLLLCARGYSNKAIAEFLGIEHQTVLNHMYRLTKKLGSKNTVHALVLALDAGWIEIERIPSDRNLPITNRPYPLTMKRGDETGIVDIGVRELYEDETTD